MTPAACATGACSSTGRTGPLMSAAPRVQGAFGEDNPRPGDHPARPHVGEDAACWLHQQTRRLEIVVEALAPVGRPVAVQRGTAGVKRGVLSEESLVGRLGGVQGS